MSWNKVKWDDGDYGVEGILIILCAQMIFIIINNNE